MPESWIDTAVQTLIVLTGVAGQLFVIRKNVIGFWFWIVSNLTMVLVSTYKGYYGLTLLYLFYCGMCIYGLKEWGRPDPESSHLPKFKNKT